MPEAAPGPARPARSHLWAWALIALVLAGALALGRGDPGPPSDAQRAHDIATEIRCPTCRGLSAADSDAPSSQAIRDEILRRVQAGQTDGQIRGYLVSRYTIDILLEPQRHGVAVLVWALPIVAGIAALGGLILAFRRWRAHPGVAVSAGDQALVDEALRR
ncbi:MAG TPA: cytochrome c-type biogenesis protein [Acidimicrobiales bacterium]|jgi:cytochrome c-type biogenesis protein CcmH|nr:cytochrome c-type biogenesis protein [Acidimicrobiales bacterium]